MTIRLNRSQNFTQTGPFNPGLLPSALTGLPNGCSNLFQTDLSLRNIITKQPLVIFAAHTALTYHSALLLV